MGVQESISVDYKSEKHLLDAHFEPVQIKIRNYIIIVHISNLIFQINEIIKDRNPTSKFINIIYTWHSFLNIVLVILSYKFNFAYTLYPATIGMLIRQTIRIMDLEGSREDLG